MSSTTEVKQVQDKIQKCKLLQYYVLLLITYHSLNYRRNSIQNLRLSDLCIVFTLKKMSLYLKSCYCHFCIVILHFFNDQINIYSRTGERKIRTCFYTSFLFIKVGNFQSKFGQNTMSSAKNFFIWILKH